MVIIVLTTVITYGNVIRYIPTHKSVHLQHCYYQVQEIKKHKFKGSSQWHAYIQFQQSLSSGFPTWTGGHRWKHHHMYALHSVYKVSGLDSQKIDISSKQPYYSLAFNIYP